MTHQLFVRCWLLLLVAIPLLATPWITQAQEASLQLNSLLVELWPEYDRPEVLVIYRGELNAATSFPARVTFRLPGYVQEMHAVAVEEDGALLNVDPAAIEMQREGDGLIFSFPVSAPGFQFEYYDPQILTRQGQERRLAYRFVAPYTIEQATFEVQEPLAAQNFSLTPPASRTFTGQNGFNYTVVEYGSLAAGATFELSASYSRSTDEVSLPNLPANNAETPVISVVSGGPVSDNLNIGYFLVGAGLVLLLGTAAYWFWSRRVSGQLAGGPATFNSARPGPASRKRSERRRERPGRSSVGRTAEPSPRSGAFCYRCGTALRDDAEFCHACGAPRRRE